MDDVGSIGNGKEGGTETIAGIAELTYPNVSA